MKAKELALMFFKNKTVMSIVLLSVLVIAIIPVIVFAPTGKTTFSVETSLKEVLENSEMLTAEYTYNSIVKVPIHADKPLEDGNIKYYVSYKGTVKSGFDFEKINVVEKDDSIVVIIPKIELKSVFVETDLEYIFTKEKYDTEKTYAEAYNACCSDLETKAQTNITLKRTAIESAIETLTAITKPLEKQLESGQNIEIVYVDNYIQGEER